MRRVFLSPRQLEALRMIAEGHQVKSGAAAMGIGSEAFKDYTEKARLKLGAQTNAQAAVAAVRQGLL